MKVKQDLRCHIAQRSRTQKDRRYLARIKKGHRLPDINLIIKESKKRLLADKVTIIHHRMVFNIQKRLMVKKLLIRLKIL
jgi:hypothetical protein